uniref:FAD-dependent oxidoreductase n=1 Tax=Desertifilum tharense IPPAS B-1220 TaxID=1781255 RepID=A0ACD5GVP5_9CYAN
MTVDYDLVVIGGSAAGVYAALFAAQLKARVALVEPPRSIGTPIWGLGTAIACRK